MASIVLGADTDQLVLLVNATDGLRQVHRGIYDKGPLQSAVADYEASLIGDKLYERLLAYKGVAPILPVPAE
jgi:hypothetical protein